MTFWITVTEVCYFYRKLINTPSLELCILLTVYLYSFHTYVTSSHFTLHLLCIYMACAEYFLIPDDAVDRRKLRFNSSLRPQWHSLKHALFKTNIVKSIASVKVYLFMLTHSHWENTVCKDWPLLSVTPQYQWRHAASNHVWPFPTKLISWPSKLPVPGIHGLNWLILSLGTCRTSWLSNLTGAVITNMCLSWPICKVMMVDILLKNTYQRL